MEEKKKRTLLIVSLAIVLALVFGISYAYFLAQDESGTQTITTQNIGLELDDGQNKQPVLLAEDIKPIDRADIKTKAVKKNFTVTNTGDEKLFVEITLDDVVLGTDNALKRFDFLWSLYEVNGETEKNISIGSFETVEDTLTIGKYLVLEPDASKEYNLYIWIEETYLNQNAMMGQEFSAKIVATGEVYWETPASEFEIEAATGTITKYTGSSKEISIPRVINETTITKIGDYVFCNESGGICGGGLGITNVIIPDTVTTIYGGFDSNQLTSVVIPNSVSSINPYSFRNNNISELIIPDSVTTNYAAMMTFSNNNLKSLVLSSNYSKIGTSDFGDNEIENLIIPEGVTQIDMEAFASNNLKTVILPSTLETVGSDAFFGNTNLSKIVIKGKTSLSEFEDSSGLTQFESIIEWK